MADFPKPTDYTALDQDTIFVRLKELFVSLFPTIDLDDAELAEFTRHLLAAQAHVGDRLAYLMNNHGREARITTAQQRRSLLGLVKLIGYRPAGASAATVEQTFTFIDGALTNPMTFGAGTIVKTDATTTAVKFRLVSSLTASAGTTSITGIVKNSDEITNTFASSGRADQEFRLSRSPYVDRSASVSTSSGVWTEVRNFLSSTPLDRHYVTIIDAQDRCTLRFGNGINGAIPEGLIACVYEFGGGSIGKLQPNTLRTIEGSFVDSASIPVRVTTTNLTKTDGGEDRQSNAMIRILAPESIRVPAASVAREDYEIVARQVSGIARSLMLTRRQDPSVLFNEGYLYVVPTDGGTASTPLLEAVAKRFGDEVYVGDALSPTMFTAGDRPKTVTFQLRVRSAVYLPVAIESRIHRRAGYSKTVVGASIRQNLADFFSVMIKASSLLRLSPILAQSIGVTAADGNTLVPNPMINFGYSLKASDGTPVSSLAWSDIFNAIRDSEGVNEVEPVMLLNGESNSVHLALREFPTLGDLTLVDMTDNGLL